MYSSISMCIGDRTTDNDRDDRKTIIAQEGEKDIPSSESCMRERERKPLGKCDVLNRSRQND